jgi:IS5 family transposase
MKTPSRGGETRNSPADPAHPGSTRTRGFLGSVVELMKFELPVPDYSTVCRRQGSLAVRYPVANESGTVIDSTGLKVYGAAEWHVQKHRPGRRRAWRKLYLGVDDATKEIVAVEVTASSVHDSLMLQELLGQIPGRVCQVFSDGAYDTRTCYGHR